MEEEELEAGPAKRRRRGKAVKKSASDLQAEWAWLAELRPEDQPWLFFALYKAYQSQVPSPVHPACSSCSCCCASMKSNSDLAVAIGSSLQRC